MIQVENLCKSYGEISAIENLNFTVQRGEVVGFLGPNGAGKSTTMKIITGFMAPSSGLARVAGIDVFEDPIEVKKRIGYLPETPPLYGDMYVQDYLQYVAALKQVDPQKISSFVADAIEKTHLGQVRGRIIDHLSKGFKQRVGIAQALVSNPDVLILDEPTVGLDPVQMHEIRQLILALRGQHTIILSTHILSEVQAVCEKVIIINKGKIVAEDSISNLSAIEKGISKYRIRVDGAAAPLDQMLSSVSGIKKVEAISGESNEWAVLFEGGDFQAAQLARLLIEKNCGLIEFSPIKRELEDVFIQLTYGQEKVIGG